MDHYTTPQEIKLIHDRGVHFVLCRSTDEGKRKAKSALETRWQTKAASLDSVLKHYAAGGLLGFIPGRSKFWVLDIDEFPGEAVGAGDLVERLGVSPLATVRTKRGLHLYFKSGADSIGNRAWSLDGFAGDIRGSNGYAIAWEPHKLADALDKLPSATPTAVVLFPKPAKAAGPRLVEGQRNTTLNADVFKAAQRGQTDFSRQRAAALAAGLDPSEVDATIRSASDAAASSTFPRKDADALEGALGALGITVRYNLRAMRAELSNGGAKWEKTTDRSSADLRRLIAGKFSYRLAGKQEIAPLKYGKESWDEHLTLLSSPSPFDPRFP